MMYRHTLLGTALAAAILPCAAHAADEDSEDKRSIVVVGQRDGAANPNANVAAPYKVEKSANEKFTEPLRDTPKTVIAIPKEVIEDLGASSLREVVRSTPGVTLGTGEGGNAFGDRIFIRGFEARNDVYIDGLRDPGVTSRETFAIEQIEVVKGPSGSFGGRGTTGGLVSLQSKQANTIENFVKGEAGVGTENYRRFAIDANQRLTDSLALRVNAMQQDGDTPGRDYVWQRRGGVTAALSWYAAKGLTFSADYYHTRMVGMPDYGMPFDTTTQMPFAVKRTNFYGVVGRDFLANGADIGTFKARWNAGNGLTFTSITRLGSTYNHYIVASPGNTTRVNAADMSTWTTSVGTQRRWSQNDYIANNTDLTAKFETGPVSHTLVAGLEAGREMVRAWALSIPTSVEDASGNLVSGSTIPARNLLNPNPVLGYSIPVTPDYATGPARTVVKTLAFYAIDTLKLGEHWALTLGARHDDYKVDFRSNYLPTATLLKSQSKFWNGQAALTYKPDRHTTFYGSWATSSNPSGEQIDGNGVAYGGIATQTANLAPERNKSMEAGVKWEAGDGEFLATAAVFQITKDNAREQLSSGVYETVGKLRSRGVEIGANGTLWDKLQVFAGYTYTDARIVESQTAANVGKRFPNVPDHSFNLLATYNFTKRFEAGGQVHYQSTIWGGNAAAGSAHIPAYTRLDLVARWKINDHLDARFNVNNLTDKVYYDAIYRSGSPFAYIAPGRQAILTLSAKY